MSPTFVCGRCLEVITDRYARCERRVVYRNLTTGRPIDHVVEAVLCRPCVEAELTARRPPPRAGSEPVALFD